MTRFTVMTKLMNPSATVGKILPEARAFGGTVPFMVHKLVTLQRGLTGPKAVKATSK
eukprot:CAMPEP_0204251890 /NCGR_PEP_ID=MMETSP0468-20130131/687_1 /ASSEMBLY_ACC=CAM_ASM_000383 /TAXON_ID=2969 /ORGANISM="Oxyrrhis marina" /LENGTH=56 /DNA_ID=CAMNT_0051225235 /DNA_START=77 /DNA_END=247 /DNA_ORIENTATION=-